VRKNKFHHICPPWKILEKSPSAPHPAKNPSDAHDGNTQTVFVFVLMNIGFYADFLLSSDRRFAKKRSNVSLRNFVFSCISRSELTVIFSALFQVWVSQFKIVTCTASNTLVEAKCKTKFSVSLLIPVQWSGKIDASLFLRKKTKMLIRSLGFLLNLFDVFLFTKKR